MKAIGGALMILAGSVLFGAGALAFAIVDAAKGSSDAHLAGMAAMVLGAFLGLLGLVTFAVGFTERGARESRAAVKGITDERTGISTGA